MSSYAGEDLFGSGPHAIRFGPWQRQLQRRGFAGVDGEMILDLGLRSRRIVQAGRLEAGTANGLAVLADAIDACCDASENTLVDNHGRSHARVILESFRPTTPRQRGRGFYCDYEIEYLQLP
jgi:hypothetical protein